MREQRTEEVALSKPNLLVLLAAALTLAGCAAARRGAPGESRRGVRFSLDTVETPAPARGAFRTFRGVVELAAGRGRLDVSAVRGGPLLAVNGVTIAAPLAAPGDYYLFDGTGFVLVRPSTRTFSSFALASSSYRHGDVREAWDGFFEFGRLRADTLAAGDARATMHGPVEIRWHLDRRHPAGPVSVLARGRVQLADAPAGEASVARWFGAAAALATMPDGVGALPGDSLQLTAVVVLTPPAERARAVNLVVLHALSGVAAADVDLARLVLPAGFTETPWPGFTHAPDPPPLSADAGRRWRTMPKAPAR